MEAFLFSSFLIIFEILFIFPIKLYIISNYITKNIPHSLLYFTKITCFVVIYILPIIMFFFRNLKKLIVHMVEFLSWVNITEKCFALFLIRSFMWCMIGEALEGINQCI
ncbi:MAG: hypothetical protein CEE43_03950 [Promethearchaeota archaeon Loki_b32]|nr:MAG: hypothetical protein CEE43_03950 [Candidatus Lokiarchaeota archaeon Loki_b32]